MKYILLDSMSHHIMPDLVKSLEWDALDSLTRDIIKFHDDYKREAADLAILAYHHNTYTKVCSTSLITGNHLCAFVCWVYHLVKAQGEIIHLFVLKSLIGMCSYLPLIHSFPFCFYQVMEFVAFKEKLERSHQLVVARIESAILSLKRKASYLEELEVTISVLYGCPCKIFPICLTG